MLAYKWIVGISLHFQEKKGIINNNELQGRVFCFIQD
jgi:hypothetical protein